VWAIIGELFRSLFTSLVTGWLDHQKEMRTEATLTKLGFDQAELAKARKEREVARRATEIHSKPTPTDIRDITNRL
jgi:hypothetical protein